MSGDATFKGTDHQAAVVAYVYVRILEGRRLEWIGITPDLPLAVEAETGGPGDDFRVEIRATGPIGAFEVQAKHTINAGKELAEALAKMVGRNEVEAAMPVVLAVGTGSSEKVRIALKEDLGRIRGGSSAPLHAPAKTLVADPVRAALLPRLHIVITDFDTPSDSERQMAVEALGHMLVDDSRASAAWDVLFADAQDLCAKRGRRSLSYLRELLTGKGFELRPPAPDEAFRQNLDMAQNLRASGRVADARSLMELSLRQMNASSASASVRVDSEIEAAKCSAQGIDLASAMKHAQNALAIQEGNGVAAGIAASVAAEMGDEEAAERWAKVACGDSRSEVEGCQALAIIDHKAKRALRPVPTRVAESAKYRLLLAQFAAFDGDTDGCLEQTKALLAEGRKDVSLLVLRIQALRRAAQDPASQSAPPWPEVETLAGQILESTGEAPRHAGFAFGARGLARREMGRVADGNADLERAEGLVLDCPAPFRDDLIRDLVNARMASEDRESAVRVLRIVQDNPLLLSWRGSILAGLGRREEALRDLEAALTAAGSVAQADEIRHYAATGFMVMALTDKAEGALDGLSEEARESYWGKLGHGRLAVLKGDPDLAIKRYREAASLGGESRSLLGELAQNLVARQFYPQAISLFEEVGANDDGERRAYTQALLRTGDLARARSVLDAVAASEDAAPTWSLVAGFEIEERQGDTASAIAKLSEVAARGEATPGGRMTLASLLVEEDRLDEARAHIEAVEAAADLTALQHIRLAILMRAVGRSLDASTTAYGAYKQDPTNPDVQRTFAGLFFTSKLPEMKAELVGPDTFVRVETGPGHEVSYTVVEGPADPSRKELAVADADALGLMGRRVGEEVPGLAKRGPSGRPPVVREVTPGIVHAALDIMQNFGDSFPTQPFLAEMIKTGGDAELAGTAEMVSTVWGPRDWIARASEVFRDQQLPLGFLATAIHRSIPETMAYVVADPAACGPLRVEGQTPEEWASSRAAASRGGPVVVTASALRTAQALGILNLLGSAFEPVAPRSLLVELRGESREAAEQAAEGVMSLTSATPIGFGIYEVPAGHAALLKHLDDTRELYEWVRDAARVEPRPLATVGQPDSEGEGIRQGIGPSSFDAHALAWHLGIPMYADDWGLRRPGWPGSTRVASFPSFGLLAALADQGRIEAATRNRCLVDLLASGYVVSEPTPEILEEAICRTPTLMPAQAAGVFNTLGNPSVNARDAAAIALAAIKRIAMRPIAPLIGVDRMVELAVAGMSCAGRPRKACAALLANQARAELRLFPAMLEQVLRVCVRITAERA
jgi:tetratricopeptide (TPR) repeat protein